MKRQESLLRAQIEAPDTVENLSLTLPLALCLVRFVRPLYCGKVKGKQSKDHNGKFYFRLHVLSRRWAWPAPKRRDADTHRRTTQRETVAIDLALSPSNRLKMTHKRMPRSSKCQRTYLSGDPVAAAGAQIYCCRGQHHLSLTRNLGTRC